MTVVLLFPGTATFRSHRCTVVDYNANLLSTPTIRSASIDPRGAIAATALRVAQPIPSIMGLCFLMRGWRPGTGDFETWIATGAPNMANPSSQPITNITVQARYERP